MIELGVKVRDKETNFEGLVTARAVYLYGEPSVMVESVDSTGRPIEWWYKEDRVEVIAEEDI